MSFPTRRMRRLRRTPILRRMVRETTLAPSDFIAGVFVVSGDPPVARFAPVRTGIESGPAVQVLEGIQGTERSWLPV